jgi:hypothetical protein
MILEILAFGMVRDVGGNRLGGHLRRSMICGSTPALRIVASLLREVSQGWPTGDSVDQSTGSWSCRKRHSSN